jgi:hypothetical protein
MRIARAYCVEAGKAVDIYQARALFFAQDEPRRRFQFLCSDDACRAANATRVTGVNYDKLIEDERDRVVVKPHFRMNPETPHNPGCEWVDRERLFEASDPPGELPPRHGEGRCFRRLKSSDLVGVLLPAQTATAAVPATSTRLAPLKERDRAAIGIDASNARNPRRLSNPTRTDFLEAVVSAYELLEPEERREAMLRIGQGPRLSYSRAFCRVEHCLSVHGQRIFHGGVRVRPHGPNFAIRFFDRARRADGSGKDDEFEISLYLKRNVLLQHWNGKFLIAQLMEAMKPRHYAHCYFFGRLVPHPAMSNRLVVDVEAFDHLSFTIRCRAPSPEGASC